MIVRVLLLALLGALAWLAGRRLATRAPRPGARPAERAGGQMVRDRVCNTFLPRAEAITLRHAGREHHFCSAACRDRFLAGRDG